MDMQQENVVTEYKIVLYNEFKALMARGIELTNNKIITDDEMDDLADKFKKLTINDTEMNNE